MTTPVKPFYKPHLRLSLTGVLGDMGQEAFSFGVSLSTGVLAGEQNGPLFQDIVQDCVAYFQRPDTQISQSARLREVKLAFIGADGKYTNNALISAPLDIPGPDARARHPFQCSLAVSLGTDRRGSSGRGRYYLPMPAMGVGADGEISNGDALFCRNSAQTWLNALNNSPGVDNTTGGVIIASGKGFETKVTTVRVGRVVDTVRSRRRSLDEAYTTAVQVT